MSSISASTSAPSPRQIELRCVRTAGVGSAAMSAAQFSASSNGVALVASASVPVASRVASRVSPRVSPRVSSVASELSSVALVASASVPVASLLRSVASVASVASRLPVELRQSRPRFSCVALLADLSCVPPVLTPIRVALRQVASPQRPESTAPPVALFGGKLRQSRQCVPQRLSSSCASSVLRSPPFELPASELPASELSVLRHQSVASVASVASTSNCPRSVLGKVIERVAAARRDDMSKRMSRRFAANPDTAVEVTVAPSCVVEKSSNRAPSNSRVASPRVSPVVQTVAGRKHLH